MPYAHLNVLILPPIGKNFRFFPSYVFTVSQFLIQPDCNRLANVLTWIRTLCLNTALSAGPQTEFKSINQSIVQLPRYPTQIPIARRLLVSDAFFLPVNCCTCLVLVSPDISDLGNLLIAMAGFAREARACPTDGNLYTGNWKAGCRRLHIFFPTYATQFE